MTQPYEPLMELYLDLNSRGVAKDDRIVSLSPNYNHILKCWHNRISREKPIATCQGKKILGFFIKEIDPEQKDPVVFLG